MNFSLEQYLKITFPYFVKEIKRFPFGIAVNSHFNTKYHNLFFPNPEFNLKNIKELDRYYKTEYSLYIEHKYKNYQLQSKLIRNNYTIEANEAWLLLNLNRIRKFDIKVKTLPMHFGNVKLFEEFLKNTILNKKVRKSYLDIIRVSLNKNTEGDLSSLNGVILGKKLIGIAGYFYSKKLSFAYMHTTLANYIDNNTVIKNLIMNNINQLKYINVKDLLVITDYPSNSLNDLLNFGFNIDSIYSIFRKK